MHGSDVLRRLPTFRKVVIAGAALGPLLEFLLIARVLTPDFTGYWSHLVFQTAGTLCLLIAADIVFARQGGLSWSAHLLAIGGCYFDAVGNDKYWYYKYPDYDKLAHFPGIAASTAITYDVLRALKLRGLLPWPSTSCLRAAFGVGLAIGVGWEVYEWIGDTVLGAARIGGYHDTLRDLIFDALGAAAACLLPWRIELGRRLRPRLRMAIDAVPVDRRTQAAAFEIAGGATS